MGVLIEVVVGMIFVLVGLNFSYEVAWKNLRQLVLHQPKAIATVRRGEKVYLAAKIGSDVSQRSPLTGTACVRWQIIVTEIQGGGKHQSSTIRLNLDSKNSFTINDPSGRIAVLPLEHKRPLLIWRWGQFTISSGNFTVSDFINQGKPHVRIHQNIFQAFSDPRAIAFLVRNSVKQTNALGLRLNLSIQEFIWQPGDPIYLWGEAIATSGDRRFLSIKPWAMSRSPSHYLLLALGGFGLVGLLFLSIGFAILLKIR